MAAGDRKIKIESTNITRANPVSYFAQWGLWIENKVGVDVWVTNGTTRGTFGTPAAWRAMTGLQMESQVTADCTADANVPARDSIA